MSDADDLKLVEVLDSKKDANIEIVRLRTSYWQSKQGVISVKRDIIPLRRKSQGYQILEEDARSVSAKEVVTRIVNLDGCEDGLYCIETCNEARDFASGCIEDYDYQLTKIT
jgi:hypothetical protein